MKFQSLLLALLTLVAATSLYAGGIKLYSKPSTSSSVVGTVAPGKSIMPIFYPKKGQWIKVANPENGHVGWVTFEALTGSAKVNGVNIEQRIISQQQGDHEQRYEVIRYQKPDPLSEKERKALAKRVWEREQQMQESIFNLMQGMINEFNRQFNRVPESQLIVPNKQSKPSNKPGWWESFKQRFQSSTEDAKKSHDAQ